jgi:hypothetical protein
MELTSELLRSFVGGQFAVDDRPKRRIVQGEIKQIDLGLRQGVRYVLIVPEWMALSDHYPARSVGWRALEPLPYIASFAHYTVSDGGNGRIKLTSSKTGEVTTLYPRGRGTLRRDDVGGL